MHIHTYVLHERLGLVLGDVVAYIVRCRRRSLYPSPHQHSGCVGRGHHGVH
jgi:hypothetical protein